MFEFLNRTLENERIRTQQRTYQVERKAPSFTLGIKATTARC